MLNFWMHGVCAILMVRGLLQAGLFAGLLFLQQGTSLYLFAAYIAPTACKEGTCNKLTCLVS